jgi:hypothetical protein
LGFFFFGISRKAKSLKGGKSKREFFFAMCAYVVKIPIKKFQIPFDLLGATAGIWNFSFLDFLGRLRV